jgi:predicted kinase
MKLSELHKLEPTIYVLVGLPGTGKSTWVRSINRNGDYVLISSDDEIERHAKDQGLTYNDVFGDYIKTATALMKQKFKDAIASNANIIWDQTNMTAKKRNSILQQVPKTYKKIAVVFQLDDDELKSRLEKRANEEGKSIPAHILKSMADTFQMPTTAEGFDDIIRV